MNRITECSNPHDDDEHTGSAKRDVASGVAGLDTNGCLLTPGREIHLTRDESENIHLHERTSGELIMYWHRTGVSDYELKMMSGGSSSILQLANMKDIVGGIAGLDAAAKILNAQMPNLLIQSQTPQILTGAGAVGLTTAITHLVTASGADAVTLADGVEGQHKTIVMKTITTGGDTSVITPAHFANGTTITGNSVGDIQNMMFTNGAWHWTGGRGAVIA